MYRKSKARYGKFAFEMFSITAAIVLGFAVTRWDEARAQRARGASAIERIARELASNRAALGVVAPYHDTISAVLDSLLRDDGDVGLRDRAIPHWRGIRPPTLRMASFTAANSSGALESVDFEDLDALTMAHEGLDAVRSAMDQIQSAFIGGEIRQISDLDLSIALLIEVSRRALSEIDQALAELEGDSP